MLWKQLSETYVKYQESKRALETEYTSIKLINHFEDLAGGNAINILYAQLVAEGGWNDNFV